LRLISHCFAPACCSLSFTQQVKGVAP
jgi:hypothetical protein